MTFNRRAALRYAHRWWVEANPAFGRLEDDAAHWISQVLWAGGVPMEMTGESQSGWWFCSPTEVSLSWVQADSLVRYLWQKGWVKPAKSVTDLQPGDLIAYAWEGEGALHHLAVVVEMARDGSPLVAAHSNPCWGRHWSFRDSSAFSEQTRYLFLHMRGF